MAAESDDDLDVENWGELPPSDNEKAEEQTTILDAENNLNHIRHISAFVMSGLKDSSDSEKKDEIFTNNNDIIGSGDDDISDVDTFKEVGGTTTKEDINKDEIFTNNNDIIGSGDDDISDVDTFKEVGGG
eukprot:301039_1